MIDFDDDTLAAELADFAPPEKKGGRSAREERIIAGFEEIQKFVETHKRVPQHGESGDIFERLYAVRLDRLRALEECRTLLAPLDAQGLLNGEYAPSPDELDDDELMAELVGIDQTGPLTELKHVRSRAEIQTAEEIANREKCEDFETFKPVFEQVRKDLKTGIRHAVRFGGKEMAGDGQTFGARKDLIDNKSALISQGDVFILEGQIVFVAEVGEVTRTPNGEQNGRLRTIYDNGTQSNILIRSLQRALYKDETGRRVVKPDLGPLFLEAREEGDVESGTIYVLRSKSTHPFVSAHRELIHKIGVTGGKVETRIASAVNDSTYLLAEVEIVATYALVDIDRTKLENLLHRIFAPAKIEIEIEDRFGRLVKAREWFLVPLQVIDEAIRCIRDGSITGKIYNPREARLEAPPENS
ncbi:MAG TPA: GIY-YIG nuclease family protein [Fibrobacteria bacterium]|nr:GIY-YIG nuclease family protein [Fibrobacteria bacterium]